MTVLKKKVQFSFWVFIALTVLLVIFSVQNSEAVEVRLLIKRVPISLAILLIGTFITGFITGALYAYKKLLPEKNEQGKKIKTPEEIGREEKDI
ncbi:LapA family protein [Alkaliflexus imshenetskii]|uniref:LapA family protein n=1 Tax=Alkaliflexus imshenetskii TaxID=286730 RepID=UPI0006943B5E|nr:LapA family protein [Alkaliflexus imshenetskii]